VTTKRRGRKSRCESRAEEFRQQLNAWKRMPESSRSSLRALARGLGTTHQLLGHYLKRWEKWQGKEHRRQANEIRMRAKAEDRSLTPWEEDRVAAYKRAEFNSMLVAEMDSVLDKMARRLKAGDELSKGEIRFVSILARKGFPTAQRIAESYAQNSAKESKNNLPLAQNGIAKSFRPAYEKLATPLRRALGGAGENQIGVSPNALTRSVAPKLGNSTVALESAQTLAQSRRESSHSPICMAVASRTWTVVLRACACAMAWG